jgi:hypothetical protein
MSQTKRQSWHTDLKKLRINLLELKINLIPVRQIKNEVFECYYPIRNMPECLFLAVMQEIAGSFSCVFFHHFERRGDFWYVHLSLELEAANG